MGLFERALNADTVHFTAPVTSRAPPWRVSLRAAAGVGDCRAHLAAA